MQVEIMLITDGGVIIRTRVGEIPVYGRSASGVIVMRLEEGSSVMRFAAVDPEAEAEDRVDSESEAEENAENTENNEKTVENEPTVGEEQ